MMKKIICTLCIVATIIAGCKLYSAQSAELDRCRADRTALLTRLAQSELHRHELTAEADRLTLTVEELRTTRTRLMRRIEELEIKTRRVEAVAQTAVETAVEIRAPLSPLGVDTLRRFEWRDPWVRVGGTVLPDSVVCTVASVDTLVQVVHRVPYRWWFFRWGTKAVRQTVSSSNPHTRIVYSEYIELR